MLGATLENLSPLLMGKGEGESIDKVIMRDDAGMPFIPASAFCGTLSNKFLLHFGEPLSNTKQLKWKKDWVHFWGDELTYFENNQELNITSQSHIIFDNLHLLEGQKTLAVAIRDGVVIDRGTGVADNKYDYELLEPGHKFKLTAEVTVREGFSKQEFLKVIGYLIQQLEGDEYRFGAHTSFGFGKMSVSEFRLYEFDFSKEGSLDLWLKYRSNDDLSKIPEVSKDAKQMALKPEKVFKEFSITGDFSIKSSLITGGAAPNDAESDKTHLHSFNASSGTYMPVLSGKSIKGALRYRAEKILKAIGRQDTEKFLNELMGESNGQNNTGTKSKLVVEETMISNDAVVRQLQDRVRIDRFTGGAADTAKFDSEPIWQKGDKTLTISLKIFDYKPEEAGLLLLLLKDLWTSDLAIGGEKNVGRGVLLGHKAEIKWKDGSTELRGDKFELDDQAKKKLEDFVKALNGNHERN